MKNKPQKHKETNVFKFKSFGDRISQIDIRQNALYHIQHVNEGTPDENETHFHAAYGKWIVLNLTEEYNVFQKQIRGIVTLPQLIHRKEFVVDLLLKSLEKATTLSLQPLLEFVVILAKDLREDFYPYFQSFLNQLIQLLNTKDPDKLEWTLICLAYLFKTLKPFLKKDITVVFNSIIPLLGKKNAEHITNFAAECFSFVARDIKDKEKFLILILNGLKKHKNGITGCGRLMFEIMRGVNGNLHSCTNTFFTIVLNGLRCSKYDQDVLFEVVKECVSSLLENTHPGNMQMFWDVCHQVLNDFLMDSVNNDKAIQYLLIIIGQTVEYRHGKYVSNTNSNIESLITIVNANVTEETFLVVSKIIAAMILSTNLIITQLDASRLTKKILSVPHKNVFETFVWNVVNYSQFEILIFPEFLRYFENYIDDDGPLELLAKIVLEKSPFCKNGINLLNWKQFPVRLKTEASLKKIEDILQKGNLDQPESFLMALIVYPHIIADKNNETNQKLADIANDICNKLVLQDEPIKEFRNKKCKFFILSTVIESIIHLDQSQLLDVNKIIETILPYCQDFKYIPALAIVDLLLAIKDKGLLTVQLFEQIHGKIAGNLSSQYHDVRLLTAHILNYFSQLPELKQPDLSIYKIFFYVENITPTVQTYRDQLLYLQKLSADMQLFVSMKETICSLDPLRYLLGVLYMNFKLLWKPVSELIASYSSELPIHEFWQIFKDKIEDVVNCIRNVPETITPSAGLATSNNFILDLFCKHWESNNRPDYLNYRILMWRMLPSFGNINQIKNRDIVTLLMDFIDVEYRKSHENDSLKWNLLQNQITEDDNEEENDEKKDKITEPLKATQRTLIAIISVLVNLENPKQIHRQPEVYDLYLELLCHRNPHIQKLSLDCIMAYKQKYLIPYKDHLYGIIDETKFKDAISGFKIDEESKIVQPEHRVDMMPILMRILYSKMVAKTQKGSGQMRKTLVMRFMGGCREEEIMILLKMSFHVYEDYFMDDPIEMCKTIEENLKLENVLSPKKLQSSLNLVEIIREQFGGLMGNCFLKHLLKVVLSIGSIVNGVLQQSEQITPGYNKMFKTLRGSCIQSITNFFNHYDTYLWHENEIESMFAVLITPILQKLPNDSIHSATPLLKLFSVFGKNPRYFVLLTKLPSSDVTEDLTPLRFILDLLLEPKTKPIVCLVLMEIIQNLLILNDEQPDENGLLNPIKANNCRLVERKSKNTQQQINFGSAILLPYMPKILEKFQYNLKKRRGLTKRDLLILSRCTELITDSETCSTLITLLLPILIHKSQASASEDAVSQMVTTITNLFQNVSKPEEHIRSIAPMFEQITAVGPRKLLCDLIHTISQRAGPERDDLQMLSELCLELNSWDKRWVEQPDYEKRLTAYKKIGELQTQGKLDINLGLMVIYHSFYFIKHDKDMAMRDSASYHLKSLVPAMAKQFYNNPKELDYLIGNIVLNLIRRTLSDKNDNVRNEGILLLGELARECPEAHPVLVDLHELTNKQDREVDFFDNITHLQVLRHGKALMKFTSVAKTIEKLPNSRTLTQFILPLTTHYLCTEKHATKHGVITSAIDAVGAVCRLLPWLQYESILKYYLKKMRFNVEYQKQLVRLVMQILDSFHFDLSKAKLAPQELAKNFENYNNNKDKEEKHVDDKVNEKEQPKQDDADEEEIILKDVDEINDLLDEQLEKADLDEKNIDDEEEDEREVVPIKRVKILVFDKLTVLSHKAAKRLVHTIATGLIPMLNNSITVISAYESYHKLNKKKRRSEREEEEILRVPIALALVKLLQKLPEGMLDHTLPGIFTKVCMFLKSPLRSVRMITRDILKNIMLTVGTIYLEVLLHQMTSLLTRGFQVHVLTVTVYSILDALKTKFKAGDIDKVMQNILSVCLEDIFGKTSEEKSVIKIGINTPEAKPSNKSYLTLYIVAINITETCMLDLLIPFKDYLAKSQSKSVVTKIEDCFQKIVMGFVLNKHISIESLLMFIYGTASESIPDLLPGTPKPVLTESEKEKIKRARPDCFIIPEEPRGRSGAIKKVIKTNVKANAHVMVELGLDILHIVLKRGKLLKINYQPFIDPLIPVLLDSLKSTHIRVTTYALKCLTSIWNREMISVKLEELISDIVPEIFNILHKYATSSMSTSNDNFGLVKNAFKAMVSLLRCVSYFEISKDQLQTLLLYIDQNLHDSNKQTIAFSLLKVIIGKQLLVTEMHDIMRKIGELIFSSESSIARQDAKNIMVNYLMDYPLGKKIDGFLKFFISNLGYDLISGRESAIHLIQAIIKRFPQDVLNKKSGYLLLSLGARLINDDSTDCRKLIAECIENLITKLDAKNKDQLFDIVVVLLNDAKLSHREMAALICSRFIVAEKRKFTERISKILPILISNLSMSHTKGPGQFVRLTDYNSDESDHDAALNGDEHLIEIKKEQKQRAKDHQLIQVLNTIIKIIETYPSSMESYTQYIDELAYQSQKLLAYEHLWVRLSSAKILEIVLSRINIDVLHNILINGRISDTTIETDYLYSNPRSEIKSLCLDLCAQLIPDETDTEMANQIVKNLLYIANILKAVPLDKQEGETENVINLKWLIRRMRYVVHAEVAKAPHSIILRTAVFHWIEGLAELLPPATIAKIAQTLLQPIVREMSEDDKNIDKKLRQLALKVGNSIKSKIGEDEYNMLRSQLNTKLTIKRAERKKIIAQTKVNDPHRAALRKEGEKNRKKLANKRKMDVLKGRALPKKKKVKRNANDDDLF